MSHHIKSELKHPYQLALEKRIGESVEWKRVSKEWLEKYGRKYFREGTKKKA